MLSTIAAVPASLRAHTRIGCCYIIIIIHTSLFVLLLLYYSYRVTVFMRRVFFLLLLSLRYSFVYVRLFLFPYAPRVFRRRRGIGQKTNYIRVMYIQQ